MRYSHERPSHNYFITWNFIAMTHSCWVFAQRFGYICRHWFVNLPTNGTFLSHHFTGTPDKWHFHILTQIDPHLNLARQHASLLTLSTEPIRTFWQKEDSATTSLLASKFPRNLAYCEAPIRHWQFSMPS